MIRLEKTLNQNWLKIGIPTILVTTLATGTLFNPVAKASADERNTVRQTTEISSNKTPSKAISQNKKILQEELAESLDITAYEADEGIQTLATAIGITPNKFYLGLQKGKTFSDIAECNGTTRDVLINYMIELGEDLVDIKLEDGRLTPDEAEGNKANMESTVLVLVDQVFGTTID